MGSQPSDRAGGCRLDSSVIDLRRIRYGHAFSESVSAPHSVPHFARNCTITPCGVNADSVL